MTDPQSVAPPFLAIECSVYRHPLFRVVSGGNNPAEDSVAVRCRHCKHVHTVTRRKLDKLWAELRAPGDEATLPDAIPGV